MSILEQVSVWIFSLITFLVILAILVQIYSRYPLLLIHFYLLSDRVNRSCLTECSGPIRHRSRCTKPLLRRLWKVLSCGTVLPVQTFSAVFKVIVLSSQCLLLHTDVLEGYNGTIFAFGQTSSGKTHTMEVRESEAYKILHASCFYLNGFGQMISTRIGVNSI